MFIFNLTYIKPILEVERVLPEHIRYLEENYSVRKFICSGGADYEARPIL